MTIGAVAQDNQYWTQQHGARATLMGGAASASTDDQAVLFYNPAAARMVKNTGITASANFMYFQWMRAKDLNDLGVEVTESISNNAPKLLVGSFDPKANARLRLCFGFVNNLYGRFNVQQSATVRAESDAAQPGTELVTGFVNISATTRDDLIGVGASYSLGEKSALGFTLFGSLFSQVYQRIVDVGVFGDPALNDTVPTLASKVANERVDIFNVGFLPKLGYFRKGERTQWGLTLTMPRMLDFYQSGSYYESISTQAFNGATTKYLLYGEEVGTAFRTPWMLDAGLETRVGTSVLAFRLGYAAAVPVYDRLELTAADELTQGALRPENGSLRRVRSASIPILNAGIGAQFRLSDAADLLAGVRTDFNHLDVSQVDRATDITGSFSYWDLYHMSCGVDWHSARAKFTAGLVYSMGMHTGASRDFETLEEYVALPDDLRFKTTFGQLGLTFGISFFVLGDRKATT
jgi:hypothetical protein